MWIETLDNKKAEQIFGPKGGQILSLSIAMLRGQPHGITATAIESLSRKFDIEKFGPNGMSVLLFIESCRDIPWRKNEGKHFPPGHNAIRAYPEKENVIRESTVWTQALKDAGIMEYFGETKKRNEKEVQMLSNVWEAASIIGEKIGGHNLRILLGAASGELAQIDKSYHFFLNLMPWIWLGHWPMGWDDERKLPIVT